MRIVLCFSLELAVEPWIEGLWVPLKEEVEHLYDSEENNCDSDASVILNGAANIETNDRSPIAYGLDMNDKVDGDKITTGHDSDITEGEKSSTIKLNPDIDCKDLELTKKQNSKSEIDNEITKNVPVETSSSQGQNSNKTDMTKNITLATPLVGSNKKTFQSKGNETLNNKFQHVQEGIPCGRGRGAGIVGVPMW